MSRRTAGVKGGYIHWSDKPRFGTNPIVEKIRGVFGRSLPAPIDVFLPLR
jgi:hypothetical protein